MKSHLHKIIEKFDVEKYFNQKKIRYTQNTTEWIIRTCPFCGGTSNRGGKQHVNKLYISKDTKQFFCQICQAGAGQNLIHLIAEFEDDTYNSAYERIRGKIPRLPDLIDESKDILVDGSSPKSYTKVIKYDLPSIDLPPNFYNFCRPHKLNLDGFYYLKSRGIDNVNLIRAFDLRYCPEMQRVIFPVYINGKVVGWQGRDITNKWQSERSYPKALTSKGFYKSRMLYGYHLVEDKRSVMITEGPIDAIKGYLCNAVAVFGKTLSETQLELLKKMPNLKEITVALDPEETQSTSTMCKKLVPFFDVYTIEIPKDTDIGDYTPEQVERFYTNRSRYNHLAIS